MPSAQIAAQVIAAIGRPDFADRLLAALREIAGCDFCSAFSWDSHSGPRVLLAAGVHPQMPGFAISASRAYAKTYWRLDVVARGSVKQSGGSSLALMVPSDIGDPNYRHDCYQRAGICQRLTLLDPVSPAISVSGYRTLARGPVTSRTARRMEEVGPILIAALRRHTELVEHRGHISAARSYRALLKRAREWGLSAREAQVAAGLATGQRQADIARAASLTLNSVITYRRRAYQKLGVSNRMELRAMCEPWASSVRSLPSLDLE
jgi:DNA-binding CsgD family transcriptional regulator